MPLTAVRAVAAELHVVFQLALWLMRICGLRISEAYGIHVGDILDYGSADRPGLIAIERQGGRGFLEYDEAGNLRIVAEKATLKTKGSVRIIAVPPSLMKLAVIRGLLMDLDATGDAERTDRAFGDFLSMLEDL